MITGNPKKTKRGAPRANYGANENTRACKRCGSAASKVTHTRSVGVVVLRYRLCLNCGQRRVGREVGAE